MKLSNLSIIILCSLFIGCATEMTVRVQPRDFGAATGDLLAQVQVNDLRAPGTASSKREAAFGVPMGNINFDPKESQLVKNVLEVELTKLLREKSTQAKQHYSCDITEFGVNTNTTPLYWDVIGRIRLVLKQDGKEYILFGTHTERTFVWPGEAIIKKVVDESFNQIIASLKQITVDK